MNGKVQDLMAFYKVIGPKSQEFRFF